MTEESELLLSNIYWLSVLAVSAAQITSISGSSVCIGPEQLRIVMPCKAVIKQNVSVDGTEAIKVGR